MPGLLCVAAQAFTDWRVPLALRPSRNAASQSPHTRKKKFTLSFQHGLARVLLQKCQRRFKIGGSSRWRPNLSLHVRSRHRVITRVAWCTTVSHFAVLHKALVSFYQPIPTLAWRSWLGCASRSLQTPLSRLLRKMYSICSRGAILAFAQ